MCGINGIFNLNGVLVEKERLEEMNALSFHRGPDDEGYYLNQSLGLSMRRLSIIDLATGKQPINNEDGSITIVFNGEIYNYVELRRELLQREHNFKTNSDTEVLVHLYEEKGIGLLNDLNGIFTFALWDDNIKQLFVARDRLGVKPLFFFKTDDKFAFSSEFKALLKIAPFAKKINEQAFLLYVLFMYVPDPLSMVQGIMKLEAGHYLKITESGKFEKIKYWEVEKKTEFENYSENAAIERLRFLLNDAVRLQLRSDVPLGIFLSGGLDSSSLAVLASEERGMPIITLSIGYEGHSIDERPFARQVAERYKTEHYELFLEPEDLQKNFSDMIWFMDEPFSDSAAVSTFLLAKLAYQKDLRVVLSGAGGDEVFGGYERYLFDWKRPAKIFCRAFSTFGRMRNRDWRLDYICSIGCGRGLGAFLSANNFHLEEFYQSCRAIMPLALNQNIWATSLQKKSYLDLKSYLVGDILMLTDKMTMAASVEARVPLLDHRIVEFLFSLPDKLKINNGEKKYLLKQAMRDKLPLEILHRPKMGFGAPVYHWLKKLFECSAPNSNFILNEKIIRYDMLRGRYSSRQILFGLEIFKRWQENVFNKFV